MAAMIRNDPLGLDRCQKDLQASDDRGNNNCKALRDEIVSY